MNDVKVENNIDTLKDKVIEEALIENVSGAGYPETCESPMFGETCSLVNVCGIPRRP